MTYDPSLISEPPGTMDARQVGTVPPAFSVSPLNPNTDTATNTLLAILQRVGDVQGRPLVPDNPWAQLGTAMQGFAAGTQGRPNPALEMFRQQRADDLAGLTGQAQIAGSIATLGDQRLRRTFEQKRLDLAETREERALRAAESEEARKRKEFALNLYKTGKDDPNETVRRSALARGQEAGIIGKDENLDELAKFPGTVMEKAHDRAISLIEHGINPLDPKYAAQIPSALRPTVERYMQIASDAGPVALNDMRYKPKDQGEVFRAQYLAMAPKAKAGTLSPDEQMHFDTLGTVLKLTPERIGEIAHHADLIRQHDRKTNQPVKPDFAYVQQAKALMNLDTETRDYLTSKGIYAPTPEQVGKAREAVRAEKVVDSQAKSLRTRAVQEYNARLGGKRSDAMFSNYSDEDLRKLAHTEDSAIAELLRGALGGGAGRPVAPGGAMKNGKTYDQNLAELMKHGRTREQAVKEVDALKTQGKL